MCVKWRFERNEPDSEGRPGSVVSAWCVKLHLFIGTLNEVVIKVNENSNGI